MPPRRRTSAAIPEAPSAVLTDDPTDSATPAPSSGRPDYRVEALAKGLRILALFTERKPTWRVSDIADEVAMPLPSVYRAVMTLCAEGYLEHLPDGNYRPAVKVLTLGSAALRSLDLVELATPRLQGLATATDETVNMAVLSGDQVLYLVRLRNSDLVTANIQVGSTLPAVYTSIGKLLLAQLDEQDLEARITPDSFVGSHGPNAKQTLAELHSELEVIRKQGWAIQDEELAFGLRSVSAPVRDARGQVVAGVNLAVQSRDWSSQLIVRELRPKVVQTSDDISALLGYEAPRG